MEQTIQFRTKIPTDDAWITDVATKLWGSIEITSYGHIYNLLTISNIIATVEKKPVGFVMYIIKEDACEIVALYSDLEKQGVGTALIKQVQITAKDVTCSRMWLLTTNDNTVALRFYQKRGFVISAVHIDAIKQQRNIKPIPLLGNDGIPIRDEIELTLSL
jgi:GNAT superfamily N-acetyltransferase